MSAEIHGFCDPQFAPLKEAFAANFEGGLELGASFAVSHRGQMVVDLWAGFANAKRTRPWEKDTIVLVYSTTKIAAVLSLLIVTSRGQVDLDAPVSRYWPEFAQGGKEGVTVREALSHRAGVPGFDTPVPFDLLNDWDATVERIAAEPHWFGGKARLMYHERTFGFLVGEIVRRVDGRRPSQFFREEVARKAGVDFQIGLTEQRELARRASGVLAAPLEPPPGLDPIYARVGASVGPGDWRSAARLVSEDPSTNGYANGRSIARLCAIFANGGALDGVRYVSEDLVKEAGTEQASEDLGFPVGVLRMGLGFGLSSISFAGPSDTAFHWGGFGGSWGLIDPPARISMGYAPNLLTQNRNSDARQQRLMAAVAPILARLS